MCHLFFKSSQPFESLPEILETGLKTGTMMEGDNSYCLHGVYYQAQSLGLLLRLDENNYGFEDKYQYMVTVKTPPGTGGNLERYLPGAAEWIAAAVSRLFQTPVALEMPEEQALKIFTTDNGIVTEQIIPS